MPLARWQHHVAQITLMKNEWKKKFINNLDIRPVVGFIKDGERLYSYGFDAALTSGLLELDMVYYLIDRKGNMQIIPCFETDAGMDDFLANYLESVGRSSFFLEFTEPDPEDIVPDELAITSPTPGAGTLSETRVGVSTS